MIIDETAVEVVNKLFEKLTVIKPGFKQAWPTEKEFELAKVEWVLAFKEAGISSIEKIKRGISHYRTSPSAFIPSPGEFISMCKVTPEDIGAPRLTVAYEEVLLHSRTLIYDKISLPWSHPCVENAYHRCDKTILKATSHQKSLGHFEENYLIALELFEDGKILSMLESSKRIEDYQEYVGRLKSDIRCKLISRDTIILSFHEWVNT